jgi:hypothetical protein
MATIIILFAWGFIRPLVSSLSHLPIFSWHDSVGSDLELQYIETHPEKMGPLSQSIVCQGDVCNRRGNDENNNWTNIPAIPYLR